MTQNLCVVMLLLEQNFNRFDHDAFPTTQQQQQTFTLGHKEGPLVFLR